MNKNTIIENGIYKDFKTYRRTLFKNGKDVSNKSNYILLFKQEEINLCFNLYNSEYCRRRRTINEVIRWSFVVNQSNYFKESKIVFITLTFNNETLEKTNEKTRRRYISRFLKENCFHYIGNIDFGDKNEREHYHAIALIKEDIDMKKWKYGISWIESINAKKNDIKKVSKYILKLNNHSYKESTKLESLIYDKQPFKIIDLIINTNEEEFDKYSKKVKHFMFGED